VSRETTTEFQKKPQTTTEDGAERDRNLRRPVCHRSQAPTIFNTADRPLLFCGVDIQTAPGGSFFLYGDGAAEFSGTLNPAIPMDRLVDSGTKVNGRFWFFHHNDAKAHNGVYFSIPVPLFRYVEEDYTLR
jgi:hypothetical protein